MLRILARVGAITQASPLTPADICARSPVYLSPTRRCPAWRRPLQLNWDTTSWYACRPAAGPSFIDSFIVSGDGRLHAAAGSPFPAQGIGPFGSEFRPTNASQLFVSNAHNGPGAGTVSAFSVANDGALNSIGTSPFPDLQTAPCWVEISHDGQVLFTVNTAVPSISTYSIAANGALTLVGAPTAFKSPAGLRPFDARLESFGWLPLRLGASKVSAFAVSGSTLTELAGSPFSLPVGASAFGIVVN